MKKERTELVIVDYGVGNLQSLRKAFASFGVEPLVSEDPEVIASAGRLVLPGVGSFEAGMRGLEVRGLVGAVKEFANSGKPMLGICLGAQLLLSRSYEFGTYDGLAIIPGQVERFPETLKEKIPHVGWNKIYPVAAGKWDSTIFDFEGQDATMYFVHSYVLKPEREENICALSSYGGYEFCAAVQEGNIVGCQFHPEKSGETGLMLIRNFIR